MQLQVSKLCGFVVLSNIAQIANATNAEVGGVKNYVMMSP